MKYFILFFLSFVTLQAQQTINISNTTVNTCDALIYDDGGPNGFYSETDYTMTICAATGSDLFLVVNDLFLGRNVFDDVDLFFIYEGTGTAGPLLFDSRTDAINNIITTNAGCVTINIQTNPDFFSTAVAPGFELAVTCVLPETCNDGILNNGELFVDCGGPNCMPCFQTVFCEDNLVNNGDFETTTNVCGELINTGFGSQGQISKLWLDQTPVQDWVGTQNRINEIITFPTADYYNAACTNSIASKCISGQGAVGLWMHLNGGPDREYIQTELNQPLQAGVAYCISVKAIATDRGDSPTNKLGFWFHNNVYANGTSFVDVDADNGGISFLGPGTAVNAQPQVSNPADQFFNGSCSTYNYSFCADGGETNLVIGNFVFGNSDSGESEYLTIDDLVISESCPVDFDLDFTIPGACNLTCYDITANPTNQIGGCEITNDFTYQWFLNGAPLAGETNQTITNVCPDAANEYSVEVFYSAGCLSITKDLIFNSTFIGVDAGEDGSVDLCLNSSSIDLFTQLGGTPDLGGIWTPGLNSGTGVFDPAIDPDGTYTYTVTGTSPCPNDSADVIVTTTTVLADNLPDVTVCDNFTLPVLTNGNYFTATNGTGTTLSAGDLISTTQTIFIYNENQGTPNCTAETDFTVTVDSTPLVDALQDVTACDSFILPTLNNGNYFTATNGGGTALNAGDLINTTQTIFIYNEIQGNPNCSAETDFTLTINATPLVDTLPDVTVCDGFTLPTLTNGDYFTATNGGGTALNAGDLINTTQTIFIYNETQSVPNCTAETDFVVTMDPAPLVDTLQDVTACDSFTLPALNNGSYFTATNGGGTALNAGDLINTTQTIFIYNEIQGNPNCSAETDFTLTINATPLVDTLPDVTVCDGFTLPTLTNGDYFTATNGGGTALNAGDLINTTQTIFIYNETQSVPNCTAETDFVVTMDPAPLVDTLQDVTACDSFTLPALNNGSYFTATNGGGTALNAGDLINTTQTIFIYNEIQGNPNCSAETDFTLTINATPLVDTLPDVTVCDGFTLPTLTNGDYFTATNGGGTALNAGDLINTTQTIFIYNETQSVPNCTAETDFVVTINTAPMVDNLEDVTVCDVFTLPVLTNGNYFTAANGGGRALNAGSIIFTTQTIFIYNETQTLPNCGAETDFLVTVNVTPAVTNLPDVTVCDGFILPALINANYFTATNGGGIALNAGDLITTTQTIFIYSETEGTPSCSAETDFTVENIDFFTVIEGDNVICLDETNVLTVNLNPNLYTFQWTLDGNNLPFNSPSISINTPGNYGITVTNNANGCVAQDNDFIVSNSAIPSTFSAVVNPGSFSDNFSIIATATGIGTYEFSLDGGIFQDNGFFEVAQGGPHFVTIRDVNGCGEVVIDLCILDYPKFFTPNGDGTNDFWNLLSPECGEIRRLVIFDRYGKLIKQIENLEIGWDGIYNGNPMPATDYWFLVDYFENEELKTFRSHFSLKR